MSRARFLILAALAVLWRRRAVAQTAVLPGQMRGRISPAGAALVALPGGGIVLADLDASLALDMSGARPVLRVQGATFSAFDLKAQAGAVPAQSYTAPLNGTPVHYFVSRNGLVQANPEDYSTSVAAGAFTVTFQAGTIQPGDIVQISGLAR